MFKSVIIMFKGIACIIRRVYAGALYLPCKILLKRFQGKEVIAVDKHIPLLRGARGVSIRLFRVFNQYARLQLRLVVLAYPSKFEFLVFVIHASYFSAFYSSFRIINNSICLCNYYIYTIATFSYQTAWIMNYFYFLGNSFFEDGGRKLSPVTTFLPVFASSSCLAFLAMPPPFLPATLFSSMPTAFIVSAICRVDSSARAVNISSASLIWSLRFCVFSPFIFLCFFTETSAHS